jgi:hypothetical protein
MDIKGEQYFEENMLFNIIGRRRRRTKLDIQIIERERERKMHNDSKEKYCNKPLRINEENIATKNNPKLEKLGNYLDEQVVRNVI